MDVFLSLLLFLKFLFLFMALLNIIKESFRLYKSIKLKVNYETGKYGVTILGLSISYVLSLLFI